MKTLRWSRGLHNQPLTTTSATPSWPFSISRTTSRPSSWPPSTSVLDGEAEAGSAEASYGICGEEPAQQREVSRNL